MCTVERGCGAGGAVSQPTGSRLAVEVILAVVLEVAAAGALAARAARGRLGAAALTRREPGERVQVRSKQTRSISATSLNKSE